MTESIILRSKYYYLVTKFCFLPISGAQLKIYEMLQAARMIWFQTHKDKDEEGNIKL